MANPSPGPSLLQARDSRWHPHCHHPHSFIPDSPCARPAHHDDARHRHHHRYPDSDSPAGTSPAAPASGRTATILPHALDRGASGRLPFSSRGSPISTSALTSPTVFPTFTNATNTTILNQVSTLTSTSNTSLFKNPTFTLPTQLSLTTSGAEASATITAEFPQAATSSSWSESTHSASPDLSENPGISATLASDWAKPTPPANTNVKIAGGSRTRVAGDLSTQTKGIIGGVVGGIAGVAFVALLLMFALRYRRRREARASLGGGQSGTTASGSILGRDWEAMVERSAPSTVTGALAALTGRRSAPQTAHSAQGGERGFYRVSGRKLPSVLHAGGDGYSDPRASVVSGGSDDHRGSQALDPDAAPSGQLALGAPMRPVSGVLVVRSSPARTPVTTPVSENPFFDLSSPCAAHDTSAQPPGSRDSTTASASKFQERI